MERKKMNLIFKTNIKRSLDLKKDLENTQNQLEINIQTYIDEKKSILDILNIEVPNNDKSLRKIVYDIHTDLLWKKIEKEDSENKRLELWNKLRPYQKEYIEEAVSKLLDNITKRKKCIIKSPTGSGKTVISYWVIAKLYKLTNCNVGQSTHWQ